MKSIINSIRDTFESPESCKRRKEAIAGAELVRLAAMVAAVSLFVFFAIFPHPLNLLFIIPALYLSYEAFTVAGNLKELFEDAVINLQSSISKKALLNQLTKSAPLSRAISNLSEIL